MDPNNGPLQGVRILDLTSMISGPTATLILGDQGADVIKVEAPGGDHTRNVSTRQNDFSASFLNNNRNKRSIVLDLKTEAGRDALHALAKTCDVAVWNFRPGVADRIGAGEQALRAARPDIVTVAITGFGETGPYAQKPVYDPLIQALSGLATVQAGSDDERPALVRTILPDKLTGYVAAQAISAALFHRQRTGEGQHIALSMLDAVMAFLWGSDMGGHTFVGNEPKEERAQSFLDLIYETRSGPISVAVQSDREWAGLCRAFGAPELLADERFSTNVARSQNINERLALTQEFLRNDTAENWLKRLEAEDVPCAPVLTRTQARQHPQMQANGTIVQIEHPEVGSLRQARPAPRFSRTPTGVHRHAPGLGDHTVEILREIGFSEDRIAAMLDEGAAKG